MTLTTEQPKAEQRDAAQMGALREILAKHAEPTPEPGPVPEPEAEPAGEETPETAELPASDETEPEEGGDAPAEPEGSDEPDELEESYGALALDGWRLSELKGLSKAALLRMGKSALKRQSDVRSKFDKHSAEIGELKQKLESVSKSEAEPGTESPGQPAGANLAEIAKRFAEVSGIEQRDAEPILAELGNSFVAPLRAELEASTNAIQTLGAMIDELVFERVQDGLVDRFPQIKTAEGVAAIKKALKKLNHEAYRDLSYRERAAVMVEEAAGMAFKSAEPLKPKPKSAPKKGQPSQPTAQVSGQKLDRDSEQLDILRKTLRKHGVA